jgi:hypothetical protein
LMILADSYALSALRVSPSIPRITPRITEPRRLCVHSAKHLPRLRCMRFVDWPFAMRSCPSMFGAAKATKWVVHRQAVGNGRAAMKYLAQS